MDGNRLMALKQAMMGSAMMPAGGAPAPAEAPPEAPAPQGAGDQNSAVEQALALLQPFASHPAIEEAIVALTGSLSGPSDSSAEEEDMMNEEEGMPPGA